MRILKEEDIKIYSIEREDMKRCMTYKCTNFCYGACKVPLCVLIKKSIMKTNKELKQETCKHDNLIDTGLCRWSDKVRLIFKCAECGKEILKERIDF